jgi:hypothetical protein
MMGANLVAMQLDERIAWRMVPCSPWSPQFFSENPDDKDERYNTDVGIYSPSCGLDNLTYSFGHDEYLYRVLKNHASCTIPEAGLRIIRFHSFYPWHNKGGYKHLLNPAVDDETFYWVKECTFGHHQRDDGDHACADRACFVQSTSAISTARVPLSRTLRRFARTTKHCSPSTASTASSSGR